MDQLKIRKLCRADSRYTPEAYNFIFESLDYTIRKLGLEDKEGVERHVNARQLLEGARDCAKERFGLLAAVVLNHMGIYCTEDIGEIVFQLISLNLLQKLPTDSKEDFKNGFSFREAFREL